MGKPNIIFLIQDQMQQRVLQEQSGCILPNLRSMMKDSMVFEKAYTCNAICSPSRASLLTGTLPHTHGMVDCTHTVPAYRAEYDDRLDTVMQALYDGGYEVSYFGKWHIERTHKLEKFGISNYQTEKDIPSFPVTIEEQVRIKNLGYPEKMVCGVFREGTEATEENYIYNEALAEIESQLENGKPFCTFISTYAPHDPYCVPREVYNLYENVEINLPSSFHDTMEDKPMIYRRMRGALNRLSENDYKKAIRCYMSYCTVVDIQIGRLIRYLKAKAVYDNTMIVCLSDHGDMMGAHGLMMKSVESFEEIYRIPLVMKLPRQERAGQICDFYINMYEIGPTVLDLIGVRALNGIHTGQSMLPWIKGERSDKHFAFAEFFGQRYSFTQRIYWKDNMKYVFNAFDRDELYDLETDPHEMNNLSECPKHQKIKTELCELMWEQIKQTEDHCLAEAEYFLMQFAPTGPGEKKQSNEYSIYNKTF